MNSGSIVAGQVKTQYGTHPVIVENIGEDAEFSLSITDAANDQEAAANNQLPIKVSGSKGSGKLLVRQAGNQFVDPELVMSDGTRIPLE